MLWNSACQLALPNAISLCVLTIMILPLTSGAATRCAGDSPVAVTRWVAKHRAQLDAADSSRFITAEFLRAIQRDKAKSKTNDEICGICGGDLWTNSQEGFARPPVKFVESKRQGASAEVIYSMRFSFEPTGPAESRSARILLREEAGCWKIDDIVHGDLSIRGMVGANR